MKTKIIYISGNELFEISDIRSAFEEVRAALSLGPDTILFGVPVDNDDALATNADVHENIDTDVVAQSEIVPDVDTSVEPVPVEKPAPRRAKKSSKIVEISEPENDTSDEATYEPVAQPEIAPESTETPDDAPVIPILSVLGSKTEDTVDEIPDDSGEQIVEKSPESEIADIPVESESVTIADMIADDAPEAEHEKTLEELLESMTPLGEDFDALENDTDSLDMPENTDAKTNTQSEDDTDKTLEKLATEFVENQSTIGNMPEKPAARGKIGKLKNILPFKKAKHDDSGLMGDLFGWAGVAANDEDFTIPGFFK